MDLGRTGLVNITLLLLMPLPSDSGLEGFHLPFIRKQSRFWKRCVTSVIELSSSPWTSPVVLVQKSLSSLHFCMDYS